MSPKTQSMVDVMCKLYSLKLKTFALCKTLSREWKTRQILGELFAKDTYDKGLLFKIDKKLLKLNIKKMWGKIGEESLRNMYKGHMDKAKGGKAGSRVGGGDRWGEWEAWWGENGDNCAWTTIKS